MNETELNRLIEKGKETLRDGYYCEGCYNDGYGDCMSAEHLVLGSNDMFALLCDGCLLDNRRECAQMDEPVVLTVLWTLED